MHRDKRSTTLLTRVWKPSSQISRSAHSLPSTLQPVGEPRPWPNSLIPAYSLFSSSPSSLSPPFFSTWFHFHLEAVTVLLSLCQAPRALPRGSLLFCLFSEPLVWVSWSLYRDQLKHTLPPHSHGVPQNSLITTSVFGLISALSTKLNVHDSQCSRHSMFIFVSKGLTRGLACCRCQLKFANWLNESVSLQLMVHTFHFALGSLIDVSKEHPFGWVE